MFLVKPRLRSVGLSTLLFVFISELILDFDCFTRPSFVRLRRLVVPFYC